MSDHPVDPRDHEPFGDRAFEQPKPDVRALAKTYLNTPGRGTPKNDAALKALIDACEAQGLNHHTIMDEVLGRRVTTSGLPPEPDTDGTGAPGKIDPTTGQHTQYWVLSEEERAKGFVEPVRHSYIHVGIAGPQHPVRDLTAEETERYGDVGYVKFEEYPEGHESAARGKFWTRMQLESVGQGCKSKTTMGGAIAETYARTPGFYGSTFCVTCRGHYPVGKDGEFVWAGTWQRVGTRGKELKPKPHVSMSEAIQRDIDKEILGEAFVTPSVKVVEHVMQHPHLTEEVGPFEADIAAWRAEVAAGGCFLSLKEYRENKKR